MSVLRLGPTGLPRPTRPGVPAADQGNDSLFVARAALRRAHEVSRAADLQVEQLRALIAKLDGR